VRRTEDATLHGTPTVSGDTKSLTRRDFARTSAITGAGVALTGGVGALASAPGALAATDDAETATGTGAADGTAARGRHGVGYGPLIADPAGLLALPEGFTYRVITYSGRTRLESGEFTPSNHDGTATFEGPRGATLIVNNHELAGPRAAWPHPVPLAEGLVYDPAAAGGCTVVEVRRDQVVNGVSPART
jgi:secreted PhoX family phosphatase